MILARAVLRFLPALLERPVDLSKSWDITTFPVLRAGLLLDYAVKTRLTGLDYSGLGPVLEACRKVQSDFYAGYENGENSKWASYSSQAMLGVVEALNEHAFGRATAAEKLEHAYDRYWAAFGQSDLGEDYLDNEIARDAVAIEGKRGFGPLWNRTTHLERIWESVKEKWVGSGHDWAFWISWWDGVLSGQQVDWELQRQVTEISEDIWQLGPDAVAAEIARLEKVAVAGGAEAANEKARPNLSALQRNAHAVRLQLEALLFFVEEEIERLRGQNSLSSRERDALTLRLEMLGKIVEAVKLMREAFEEEAPRQNALVVVEAQLPAVVEAADKAVTQGEAPEVSAAIVSMASAIKYLTDAGTPGNYATGIAFADTCMRKIKGWLKSK
ncbi:hypothetical protein OEZ71_03805 [Defluviimonas sp. WL0050]|uniref:Uncharacterized protein n=1 Tax=Albidovulum litorale TaxID=2984134 RepID=A0ABT2ZJX8_9RHOB|nr:hypothetical protein [Defluviimonas sp. WL0050]MCV2871415.1 hypothetical protein [Defluviimonas sp. WL0050]